ncbi:ROK family transcriptional regulator [Oceanobacillus halophilus]|uniref:ROK family transcriptional regulator n=1 Tax=Oceanobacillus halophilus TaxID=930130 RepID=A0A495A322_9BACI|nr:ROK family transcriptional regulator [Oceanobacillus halophilus]RKQ32497.1 ROK family transcriptional regulator [Oceanobacillus halophilus]
MRQNKRWNQQVVKKENKTLVLDSIRNNAPISRADIASLTGLNKGTVSSLVNELLGEKLIYESGPGKSSGGRRPVLLYFNQLAGYSIGIDLGVNYLLGILTNLEGNICHEKYVDFDNLTYEEILQEMIKMVDYLSAQTETTPYGIIGIGVGVPGIISNDSKILLAPNLNWRNIDLKEELESKFGVPVTIENEANAGAYGEKTFGIGKNHHNIIYVSVGIGIGVGLILNGRLYKGNNGFSGEFGHMTIEVGGTKCSCGSEGCWELYASERALIKSAQRNNIHIPDSKEISLEKLISLAKNGDHDSIQLFEEIGKYLGVGINNIINIFNPEQVIIGNRIAAAETWLKEPLRQWVENQTLWFSQKDLKVDFSALLTHSAALGVSAFAVEKFLLQAIETNEGAIS